MFLVQAFRAHQREPVSIRLVNVNKTREKRFAELCLDGVSSIATLQQENSDFPELNNKDPGIELFIVLVKTQF